MFRGIEKKKLYSFERIWFPSGNVSSKADIIRYLRSNKPKQGFFSINEKIETVVTDLTLPVEDILARATKTVRYEVNKCEKEDIVVSFYKNCRRCLFAIKNFK